jgi:hypothetical protein
VTPAATDRDRVKVLRPRHGALWIIDPAEVARDLLDHLHPAPTTPSTDTEETR